MSLVRIFKSSLKLPSKKALFSLNRESMRDTMIYILVLMFLICLPDATRITYNYLIGERSIPVDLFITQLIIIYPFLVAFLMVAGVSLHAGIAYVTRSFMRRKLAFQQLWKMTAYALTIPVMLTIILRAFQLDSFLLLALPFILLHVLLYQMITVFPKRKT
ncbi:DUF1189 family protein [Alkalibacillus haloalkaliphilus]|uniref:DUF1189 family protein n=1 Tax=Alkalibacillus haloalkaliphilus TaxID=94136 RepID=UPI002936A003|nr:DUF1189 family protein [Alkalibacillus haloalkaliphilus]MDV2581920.1 DUF1189 family protein [Alkalibacillus haloalkaliphilus]